MKALTVIASMIMIGLLWACSPAPIAPDRDAMIEFAGTYEWIKSVGGFAGTETPETCECTRTLTLGRSGDFKNFYDGELISSSRYSMYTVRQPSGEKKLYILFGTEIDYPENLMQGVGLIADTVIFHAPGDAIDYPTAFYVKR